MSAREVASSPFYKSYRVDGYHKRRKILKKTERENELTIFFNLNSSILASSGVMVAHLMPTPYLRMASAASLVTSSSVWSLFKVAHVVRAGKRKVGGGRK